MMRLTVALILIMALVPRPAPAQDDLVSFLRDQIGFSTGDLQKLANGEAIVRTVKQDDKREVMVVGAVQVRVETALILDALSAAEVMRSRESVIASGRFSPTPVPADVALLELPSQDIEALLDCEVGDCDIKLSADVIERLHANVDWSADDYAQQANRFIRGETVRYLSDYVSRGDAALITYGDKREPLSVEEGFDILAATAPYLRQFDSSILEHLRDYPENRPESVTDVYYWTLEDFGLKPVLNVRHLVATDSTTSPMGDMFVVIRDIYSSHYFQAGLQVFVLNSAPPQDGLPSTYAVTAVRQRFDSKVGGRKRGMLEKKLRNGLRDMLESAKDRIERAHPRGQ